MAATEKMEKMVDTDQVEDIDQIKAERGSMLLDDDDAQRAMARKVLWKLDTRILPVLALLFLCSFLDRTNVGNAKILGLEKSIGVNDHQYASGLAIFFAFYIASELPSNLVLKKISPRIWLPCLTFAWGIVGMCLGFVQNYAGFLVVRAFLGITEGGLLPGMVLYLSSMYTRGELALRIGLFYTTASLSGAFGGLLARGLSSIGATAGIDAGWRWIMIVEGLLTAVVGASAYFLLPNDVSTARFLTEEEREFALYRLSRDHSYGLPSQRITEPERFSWSEVRRGVLDPSLWFSASAYFAILCGLYSFGLFLPTIITGLGYTANEAQLWSVIPYAVASCLTIVAAFLSDRLRLRGPIMLCTLPLAIIGYAVIANVTNPHVKFGHYKRATATGLQLAIANCGGFVSDVIDRSDEYTEHIKRSLKEIVRPLRHVASLDMALAQGLGHVLSNELLRQEAEQASKALEELKKDITAFKAQISKKNKEDAESKITALENKITALEAHIERRTR
ncbi:unnamed protein product [Aureobasidium pullulans]|nr:unnamed protein product [Aureobasidium pullulans]